MKNHGGRGTPKASRKNARKAMKALSLKSRPGAKAASDAEAAEREAAYVLGSKLSYRLLRKMAQRVDEDDRASELLERGVDENGARLSIEGVKALLAQRMTNIDLVTFNRDVQDRFGAMRRTQTDMRLADARPALLVVDGGLGWPAQGGKDAEVVDVPVVDAGAAGGAGDGDAVH